MPWGSVDSMGEDVAQAGREAGVTHFHKMGLRPDLQPSQEAEKQRLFQDLKEIAATVQRRKKNAEEQSS